jgi:hypothetical protein
MGAKESHEAKGTQAGSSNREHGTGRLTTLQACATPFPFSFFLTLFSFLLIGPCKFFMQKKVLKWQLIIQE